MPDPILLQERKDQIRPTLRLARKLRLQAQLDAEQLLSAAKKQARTLEILRTRKELARIEAQSLIIQERLRVKQIKENQETIIEIASLLAKECLLQEWEFNQEIILGRIENAIESVLTKDNIKLYASERNLAILEKTFGKELELYISNELGPFDFKLSTPLGSIEGKLDEQLESMKRALLESVDLVFRKD
jgi:flagellar biosynthesis/type III secretory pathway protein FliH